MKLEKYFAKLGQNPKKSCQNLREFEEKSYYIGESILFSTISNRTILGIVLSEFVLSGDHLPNFCIPNIDTPQPKSC